MLYVSHSHKRTTGSADNDVAKRCRKEADGNELETAVVWSDDASPPAAKVIHLANAEAQGIIEVVTTASPLLSAGNLIFGVAPTDALFPLRPHSTVPVKAAER